MKRRTFIKRTLPVATLPFLLNGFPIKAFGKGSLFEKMLKSAPANDRVLVIIQMQGGNDGLNTVIPLDQYTNLSTARANILIPENLVLSLDGSTVTGLHPAMPEMQSLFNDGLMNIVQGVSYANPDFSHFGATDIWLTGSDSGETLNTGWVGRFLAQEYPAYPAGFPNSTTPDPIAMQIGSTVSTALQGPTISMGIAITSDGKSTPLGTDTTDVAPATPAGHELTFIRETAIQTNAYASVIQTAAGNQANLSTLYPKAGANPLADQLKIVAQLIGGGLQTKVYMVNIGSFDTHSAQVSATGGNQTGNHANLLSELSVAINAFQNDITLMGVQDRVIGMTFSEFGRRIISNSALGTDHGTSEPMFVFGTKAQSGLTGTNPVIPANANVNDNLAMQFDFRSVYASILQNWFCVSRDELINTMLASYPILNLLTVSCDATNVSNASANSFSLRNYPNPANSSTIIEFQTANSGNLQIKLYDEVGKEIETVVQGNYPAGSYTVDMDTHLLPKGAYFYTLQQGYKKMTSKMLVM